MPDSTVMYRALVAKDSAFEGVFFAGVKTTGIFCRPSCTARKPKRVNVVFFASAREALLAGYRPCRKCHPLELAGDPPDDLRALLEEVERDPALSCSDSTLAARGLDPVFVRRWFKKNYGLTFQAYLRALRVGMAFGRIVHGDRIIDAGFQAGWESSSAFSAAWRKLCGNAPSDARRGKLVTITRMLTPLGPMLAGATDSGICLLEFVDRRMLPTQLDRLQRRHQGPILPGTHPLFQLLDRELKQYFGGTLRDFSVPLDLTGTEFQKHVWSMLRTIPYGQTRSYGEQAVIIGNPKATRAVARANGDNNIAIVIPCHRVVGSDGKLVGYGGGLWRKKWLLTLEKKTLLNQ